MDHEDWIACDSRALHSHLLLKGSQFSSSIIYRGSRHLLYVLERPPERRSLP